MARIDAAVAKRGTVEIWDVTTTDGTPHNFHIHDVQFQVASIDGEPAAAVAAGLEGHRLPAVRPRRFELGPAFADYADPDTPYMFHCHLLSTRTRG